MNIYFPEILNKYNSVSAFFTEANRSSVNLTGEIPGLNLGYNTPADKQEIDKNFNTLIKNIDFSIQKFVLADQIHGTSIQKVDKPGTIADCDGLITDTPELAIGIRVADCAAVLIADPFRNIVGAFHAGWKGAAGNILSKGIDIMVEEGAVPENLIVYCSPCISQKNFEVGEEVAQLFPEKFVDRVNFKKPHVDLKGSIRNELLENGVLDLNIEISDHCTIDNHQYFSFRRERDNAGRMLAMIKINAK